MTIPNQQQWYVIIINIRKKLERNLKLKINLLPTLLQYVTSCKRYVDDTISYVKFDALNMYLMH